MLRDIDWPGARERHARWRHALGVADPLGAGAAAAAAARRGNAAATLVTSEPDAPFRLLREVDRGGAGAVYEAEDRALGRRVALKVYHRRHERDRAQLLHEARVAVALAGPGIVRVFDVDAEQGWLAMEWVHLGTFRAFLRARVAALRPLRRWALPLARALARVHARGWVHHDVKPANILLGGTSGEPDAPLLSDFGTARRIGEASPPGSMGYVSPERLALGARRPSTPRDDVYGFGRVLEEALDALAALAAAPGDGPWRILAAACTAPDEARLDSGESLARAMEGLPA
jgi:serine/threonine-protein kinase